jgi:cytochrome c biogenesis protein CcmG, thiol:disulfide interchange protein DsbE
MKPLLARLLIGVLALSCLGGAAKVKIDEPAPRFTLTLLDGRKIRSEDLRGQVVILNFWATWCGPCRKELPLLNAYATLRKDRGLQVFAVTTEDSVSNAQLKKFYAMLKMTPIRGISGPYDTLGGVPTNYVIDRAGRLRYAKAEMFDLDSLNALLVPLLNEPAPPPLPVTAEK